MTLCSLVKAKVKINAAETTNGINSMTRIRLLVVKQIQLTYMLNLKVSLDKRIQQGLMTEEHRVL
jgi:hypothetical protein